MNSKNIKKHLSARIREWMKSIDDEAVKKVIKDNVMVTGGALVSLLTGEEVNDYDIYFRTQDACITVADYYVKKWNESHSNNTVSLRVDEKTGRVSCFIRSAGVAGEESEKPDTAEKNENKKQEKYRPVFFTSNAITLSDKIQLVTRFYGEIEEIHKNYDFAHCTCAWSSWDNEVFLPQKALECIINKELYYVGSKYPLCSIIRTRKYIERGYHINAGQYVKMAMQLNDLNLRDVEVLEEQLTGVDTAYFALMIDAIRKSDKSKKEADKEMIDTGYVIELINKLF